MYSINKFNGIYIWLNLSCCLIERSLKHCKSHIDPDQVIQEQKIEKKSITHCVVLTWYFNCANVWNDLPYVNQILHTSSPQSSISQRTFVIVLHYAHVALCLTNWQNYAIEISYFLIWNRSIVAFSSIINDIDRAMLLKARTE